MKRLIVDKISKNFNENYILRNISFEVTEKDFLVLVGPSGCGKTTTLRIIAGLEQQTTGNIIFNDRIWNDVPPGNRNVGMVFQNYALYPHLNVFENLAFPLTVQKVPKQEIKRRVLEIASLLQLEKKLKHKPKELSGGERQRVALGRAIIRQPNIFLFDEPLSNLDAKLRVLMRTEIINLVQRFKVPSIYVTHDQIEALTMGTKVAILKEGVIQQIGTPREVYFHPKNIFVATFIGSPQMNLFNCFYSDGMVIEKNKLFQFKISNFLIDANSILENLLKQSKEFIIGIRPEDLHIANESSGIIHSQIRTYEYTGYEAIVYFGTADSLFSFVAKDSTMKFESNETIHLSFEFKNLHFFDKNGDRFDFFV